jgi:uncharacterized protein YkwD
VNFRIPLFLPIALGVATIVSGVVWISRPSPVSASTESSMASTIAGHINSERGGAGLVGLRVDPRLAALASDRASWMASTGLMSHQSFGGEVYDAIAARGVSAWTSAEAIGSTSAAFGTEAADYLYGLWRGSQEHWNLMLSRDFNYIGVGVAYRQSTGETFASIVFAEAQDSTRPVAQITSAAVSGHTITFTWTGRDGVLQSHTAGLKDYDVQYRVDNGAWSTLRSKTTTTRVTLTGRSSGHSYSVRVRDRDRRNNLSAWTLARTVRVR